MLELFRDAVGVLFEVLVTVWAHFCGIDGRVLLSGVYAGVIGGGAFG